MRPFRIVALQFDPDEDLETVVVAVTSTYATAFRLLTHGLASEEVLEARPTESVTYRQGMDMYARAEVDAARGTQHFILENRVVWELIRKTAQQTGNEPDHIPGMHNSLRRVEELVTDSLPATTDLRYEGGPW